MTTQADFVARAKRLRSLMAGPPDPATAMAGIQEIVNDRIRELNGELDKIGERFEGNAGGSEPES